MTQCPSCLKTIAVAENNYGTLYRCEHCTVEFFIGFDGMPENSKEPLVSEEKNISDEPIAPLDTKTLQPYGNESENASVNIYNIDPTNQQNRDPLDQQNLNSIGQSDFNEAALSTDSAFQNYIQDVRDFGNDSVATGILSFDIEISGIDLAELKSQLLEALDDKRFGWNLPELSQKIKDGKLTISNISAPKIIVLVKRIMPIGLGLNWRHHVSTQ